jgi:hypothetical protein
MIALRCTVPHASRQSSNQANPIYSKYLGVDQGLIVMAITSDDTFPPPLPASSRNGLSQDWTSPFPSGQRLSWHLVCSTWCRRRT